MSSLCECGALFSQEHQALAWTGSSLTQKLLRVKSDRDIPGSPTSTMRFEQRLTCRRRPDLQVFRYFQCWHDVKAKPVFWHPAVCAGWDGNWEAYHRDCEVLPLGHRSMAFQLQKLSWGQSSDLKKVSTLRAALYGLACGMGQGQGLNQLNQLNLYVFSCDDFLFTVAGHHSAHVAACLSPCSLLLGDRGAKHSGAWYLRGLGSSFCTHTHTHLHSLFGCFWLMKSFRLSNAAEMPCRSALKLCWTNGLLLKVRIISIDFPLLAKTCMKVLSLLVEYCCFREDSQSGWRFPEAAVIWASWLCKLNFLFLRASELNTFSCVVCTFRQETHERILSNPEDEEDNSGAVVANLAMACGCLVCFYCPAVKDTRSLPTSSSSWQICPSWRQSEPLGKCWQPDSHWGQAS